jgi:hypothetical protein
MRFGKKAEDGANAAAVTDTESSHHSDNDDIAVAPISTGNGGQKPDLSKTMSRASSVHEYPTGIRLTLLMVSVFVSMFLVALDRLIISTVRVVCCFSFCFFSFCFLFLCPVCLTAAAACQAVIIYSGPNRGRSVEIDACGCPLLLVLYFFPFSNATSTTIAY